MRSASNKPMLVWGTSVLLLATCLAGSGAVAQSLTQAYATAYRSNPTLDAQRARLRAADEAVAIARSAFRPQITGNASATWDRTVPNTKGVTIIGGTGTLTTGGITTSRDYGINVGQLIFDGFQSINRVRAAEAVVRAGRADLRRAEQALFINVATAYTNILSAQSYALVLEAGVRDAARELRRTRKRLELQETTRTDVAQAQALLADIRADLADARGRVQAARAAYRELVGQEARRLSQPTIPRKNMPKTLNQAISIGMNEHPAIISSLYLEQAARNNVDIARGRLLPQVGVVATYDRSFDSQDTGSEDTSLSANVRIPIYQGGANHAAVRQAKELHVSNLQLVAAERARVRLAVSTAWTGLRTAKQRHGYVQERIRANKAIIVGIRKEETIGQRTLNDLLVAQRNLLRSRNDLLIARQAVLIESYRLLAEIGRLNAEDYMPSNAPVYDPKIHHQKVHRKWFGLSITHSDGSKEEYQAKVLK